MAAEPSKFSIDDLVRISNLSELDLSPDGEYVVYSVGEPEFKSDKPRYDIWRARWDGSDRRPLTRTAEADEYQPASARTARASLSCPIAAMKMPKSRCG